MVHMPTYGTVLYFAAIPCMILLSTGTLYIELLNAVTQYCLYQLVTICGNKNHHWITRLVALKYVMVVGRKYLYVFLLMFDIVIYGLTQVYEKIHMTLNSTFQGHSKIKSNGAVEIHVYDFVIMSHSINMSILLFSRYTSRHLKIFHNLLLLALNFRPPPSPLTMG